MAKNKEKKGGKSHKNRKLGRNVRRYGAFSGEPKFGRAREKRNCGPKGWYRQEIQATQEESRAWRNLRDAERHYELVADEWTDFNLQKCRLELEEAIAKKNFCRQHRTHMNKNNLLYMREPLPWQWFKRAAKTRIRLVKAIWGWVPLEIE